MDLYDFNHFSVPNKDDNIWTNQYILMVSVSHYPRKLTSALQIRSDWQEKWNFAYIPFSSLPELRLEVAKRFKIG